MSSETEAKLIAVCEDIKSSSQFREAADAMRNGTSIVLSRLKNNFGSVINDSCDKDVANLKEKITSQLEGYCNSWVNNQSNQLIVFPEGTRFVHREGRDVNIVIEQKPTVRVINFLGQNYNVALPFVQFYIVFSANNNNTLRLIQVRISGSKKPISSLDSNVERLQLPNMGNSLCLGDILNHASSSYNLEVDISTKCNEIINLFWQSEFNIDLSEYFRIWLDRNFSQEYRKNGDNGSNVNIHGCMAAWHKKSAADPLFVISNSCLYESYGPVSQFISSDYSSRNNRAVLLNNITGVIQSETENYVSSVISSLNSVDVAEENRNSAHLTVLTNNLNYMVNQAYSKLWKVAHSEHKDKVFEDESRLSNLERDISVRERNLGYQISNFNSQKESWDNLRNLVQLELFNIYNYLQDELKSVESIKAKLQQNFDEQGAVLSKPRRGRPKKESLPPDIEKSIDLVASSGCLVGPNGETLRKRGRPRKVS
jgi:hypothetical protein